VTGHGLAFEEMVRQLCRDRENAPSEPDHSRKLCHLSPLVKSLFIHGLITHILISRQVEGANRNGQADALRGHEI
jgi:hypothetical protein